VTTGWVRIYRCQESKGETPILGNTWAEEKGRRDTRPGLVIVVEWIPGPEPKIARKNRKGKNGPSSGWGSTPHIQERTAKKT